MFGRKPPAGTDSPQPAPTSLQTPTAPRPVAPPIPARPAPAVATTATAAEGDADGPRPVPAQPVRRPPEPVRATEPPAAPAKDVRKLVVGKDITLSGELACDHLIVEGVVEASVKECQRLEIAETGLFKGTVEIKDADIGGRFEGDITVQGRLTVRSTGRIDGRVQYGELAVEAGGTLDGEIRTVGKGAFRSGSRAGIKAPTATEPLPLAPLPNSSPDSQAAS